MIMFFSVLYFIVFCIFLINSIMEYGGKVGVSQLALFFLTSILWPVSSLIVFFYVYKEKSKAKVTL